MQCRLKCFLFIVSAPKTKVYLMGMEVPEALIQEDEEAGESFDSQDLQSDEVDDDDDAEEDDEEDEDGEEEETDELKQQLISAGLKQVSDSQKKATAAKQPEPKKQKTDAPAGKL